MDFKAVLNARVEELTLAEQKHAANYNVLIGQLREARQAVAEFTRVEVEKTETAKKKAVTKVTTKSKRPAAKTTTAKTTTVTKLKKAS